MKRLLCLTLALLLPLFGLLLVSCGENAADKKAAEACARKEALNFYYDKLSGKSFENGYISNAEVRIAKTEYKNGKYVVSVLLTTTATVTSESHPLPGYKQAVGQYIEYTIRVSGSKTKVVNVKFGETTEPSDPA